MTKSAYVDFCKLKLSFAGYHTQVEIKHEFFQQFSVKEGGTEEEMKFSRSCRTFLEMMQSARQPS